MTPHPFSIAPIPVAGAILVAGALLALFTRRNALAAGVALVSQTLATAVVLAAIVPVLRGRAELTGATAWSFPIETIGFRVDALSACFLAWSLPMTLLGTIYAVVYLRPYFDEGRRGGPHFALLNLTSLAFVVVYSVQNALVFLLGWEIAAVAAWLLVIWDYRKQKIRFAGFNYLVSTHVGLFVLVAAFMVMHAQTGSMDFGAFSTFLGTPSRLRAVTFLLLSASFALKSAFFPFHTWLPRAHSAAPAHVSALMSGVIHKAGLFAFLRFTLLMGAPEEWMGWGVLAFGAVSAFVGVLYTTAQRDMKRLLGYSSTENVGIAAIGFGVGYLGLTWREPTLVALGFGGGLLHVLNHALFKCLLFYAAGAVYRQTHTVDLERLGGLLRRMPRTGATFLLGSVAMAALPPLNGFVSELLIYAGLLSGAAPSTTANVALVCVAAVLAFVGGVAALSIVRAFGIAFLGAPRDASVHEPHEVPPSMLAPMYLHAALVVLVGLLPAAALLLTSPASALFGARADVVDGVLRPLRIGTAVLLGTTALLVGVGWLSGRRARRHVTWGCGYTAQNARMQYTGSSFSKQLAGIFEGVLPELRREQLPSEIFPREPGRLATHHVDAVEHRMFEVLGQGEEMITKTSQRIPEEPKFAFAAGLITLVIVIGLIAGVAR